MIFVMYECEERLGYTFKDKTLLRTCFTHSSYSHEHGGKNNELLEFFGDAILEFVVTEYLFAKYPTESEGVLTGYRQQIVSRKPLAEAIVRLGLNEYILFGEGERKNPPEHHEAACENLFEALVAGIYIDGGLDEAKNFIRRVLLSRFRPDKNGAKTEEIPVAPVMKTENYKGRLQEYVQKNKLGEIVYREKNKTGPAHDPVFTVSVTVGGRELGTAAGRKKSDAEQSAAKTAFDKLTGKPDAKTLNNAKNTANIKSGKAVKNKNRGKTGQRAGISRPDNKQAGNRQTDKTRAKEKQTTGNKSRPDNKKSGKGKLAANPERRKIK
ncbi:MAG: ribonuclease III [Clostridiales bacterium]|nr:ribonuclease III [Clostridiales bacterium]